jgi:hypothetical protein
VLYRPTPYFAFGGGAAYARSTATAKAAVSSETLGLSLVGRVYLLEEGPVDPYFEALLGWSSERTSSHDGPRVTREVTVFGPAGRAGGGADWFLGSSVKLGVFAGYSELVASGGGAVTAGLGLSLLWGDSL